METGGVTPLTYFTAAPEYTMVQIQGHALRSSLVQAFIHSEMSVQRLIID